MTDKKIVLITSGQPSLNPRLVKEADSLANTGYNVTVLYAYWNDWGTLFDEELLKTKDWKAIRVGGDPKQKTFTYFFSRLIYRTALFILKNIGFANYLTEVAAARGSYFLIREAKKHKADLYIAHNLGALPAAAKAAKANNKPFNFDAEDFHRNEVSDNIESINYKISKYIEDKYLNRATIVTAASPLIAHEYKKRYPAINVKPILNVFERVKTEQSNPNPGGLKLFWFSQFIGEQRGVEEVIEAISLCDPSAGIILSLLGNYTNETYKYFNDLAKKHGLSPNQVTFYKPIPPGDIFNFAMQFDIGLATEQAIPYNRDICLTNKIFTYIQAGLAVIASDTLAQVQLLNQHKNIGTLYKKGNAKELANALKLYINNPDALQKAKQNSYMLGQTTLNWETESEKLMDVVKEVLNKVE
ncbi:glycosyltransferase [Mucilaginibacter sp.]|jgi:glycosyltransferase involved in cell wall biosynthesis|uniref:glycosyltransferase n=1 Tax=Mucilaginibacter sp. TaxID=1882438 RepID=UPI003561E053